MANKEAKAPVIDALADRLGRSSIAIVTDYRGLTVAQITALRRRLRDASIEYQVAKNTLTRFAAERVNKSAMHADLEGPSAIAFAYDDPAAAAKTLQDYLRTTRLALTVKGAMLGDRRLAPEELQGLADLPAKPVLQARLVGTLAGPMATLVGTVNGLLSQLVYILDQRVEQQGGDGAATASTATGAPPAPETPGATEAPTSTEAPEATDTSAPIEVSTLTEAPVAMETAAPLEAPPSTDAAEAAETSTPTESANGTDETPTTTEEA